MQNFKARDRTRQKYTYYLLLWSHLKAKAHVLKDHSNKIRTKSPDKEKESGHTQKEREMGREMKEKSIMHFCSPIYRQRCRASGSHLKRLPKEVTLISSSWDQNYHHTSCIYFCGLFGSPLIQCGYKWNILLSKRCY